MAESSSSSLSGRVSAPGIPQLEQLPGLTSAPIGNLWTHYPTRTEFGELPKAAGAAGGGWRASPSEALEPPRQSRLAFAAGRAKHALETTKLGHGLVPGAQKSTERH